MTDVKAADLPEGSIVVDDNRLLAWIAIGPPRVTPTRWLVTGSGAYVRSDEVDAALEYSAKVLRVGTDGD